MSFDNVLQRSVRLLDEAVGSPTSYTSPSRGFKRRSSMFTNSVLPLRHSEVRQYALNNSLTMSTSELEAYMDTSYATQPLTQAPPVRQPSDDLYQTFLESLQAHSSAREVFGTIAGFEQNCSNILEVMRETYDAKELKWLEQERNIWRLVLCLYENRLSASEADMDEDMAMNIVRPPSEKEIMKNLYKTNFNITEYQLIVDWLEKNAADAVDASRSPQLQHYMDNTVAWENTLHQLQNKNVAYASSRPIVDQLDPDAPLRQGKPLHDLDMEDEARLMKQVWEELRCGRLKRAQAACLHCGQPWRAASLEGWRLYHDPNYTGHLSATEKEPVEGNPHRDKWKLCAWRLADNIRAGKHTRAAYGALCGHIAAVLPACQTWEDLLWAHTKALVDQMVEKEIRNNSLRDYVPLPSEYWDAKLSMEDTFASLEGSADLAVRQQAASEECVLQKLLILDRLPQMLRVMLDWTARQDCAPQMLRFLAHLVLTLEMLGQPACQETGHKIIKAYVKMVMNQQDPNLVAFYTATLTPEDQVTLYADFLQKIDQSELRKVALTAAETVHLPVEAITQRVVENIREERDDKGVSLQLSSEVTEEERRKISSLEWVVLYPTQRAEALWQANALIRTFLGLGKTQAARLAFNQIPGDSIDHVMNQWAADNDSVSVCSDSLPSRVSAAVQEYLSHKAYLDAQEGFADWFSHYQHAKPTEPPSPGPGATFTEKVAHDHRMVAYRRDLERWQATMDHQTKCVKEQLYNVLLFPRGGWLADCYREDRPRASQMKSLRTLCIPQIALLLHTVLHTMGQYKEAVQLADLVVAEQHHLYKVYSKQQMGELLSKIRESSLACLAQGKDPWGLPVTS